MFSVEGRRAQKKEPLKTSVKCYFAEYLEESLDYTLRNAPFNKKEITFQIKNYYDELESLVKYIVELYTNEGKWQVTIKGNKFEGYLLLFRDPNDEE